MCCRAPPAQPPAAPVAQPMAQPPMQPVAGEYGKFHQIQCALDITENCTVCNLTCKFSLTTFALSLLIHVTIILPTNLGYRFFLMFRFKDLLCFLNKKIGAIFMSDYILQKNANILLKKTNLQPIPLHFF